MASLLTKTPFTIYDVIECFLIKLQLDAIHLKQFLILLDN